MGCRTVVLMLPHVGGQLRVHSPAERHKPEREPCDCTLSKPAVHRSLSKSCGIQRFLFLNSCHDIVDLFFGQQSALDIFLYPSLLIDEDAHR